MIKQICVFEKPLFTCARMVGFILDPDFIIPSKGDIISITEEQVRVWNGKYTHKPLKVLEIRYDYRHNEEKDETLCYISITVRMLKNKKI